MHRKSLCADDLRIKTIEKFSPLVYRLAFSQLKTKSDADDIHQEVFVRYITKKPKFESEEHAKAWFIKVTTNLCKNWWKTAWRRRVISMSEYEESGEREIGQKRMVHKQNGSGNRFEGLEKWEDEETKVIDAVKTLPQKYRVVIHLFYYEEMSIEEIGRALGLKESTVRTQLTRARRKLSELLKEDI